MHGTGVMGTYWLSRNPLRSKCLKKSFGAQRQGLQVTRGCNQVDGDGFDAVLRVTQTWLLLVATTPSMQLQPLTCKSDLFRIWMWTETMLNRQSFQGAPLGNIAKEEMGSRHDSLAFARFERFLAKPADCRRRKCSKIQRCPRKTA